MFEVSSRACVCRAWRSGARTTHDAHFATILSRTQLQTQDSPTTSPVVARETTGVLTICSYGRFRVTNVMSPARFVTPDVVDRRPNRCRILRLSQLLRPGERGRKGRGRGARRDHTARRRERRATETRARSTSRRRETSRARNTGRFARRARRARGVISRAFPRNGHPGDASRGFDGESPPRRAPRR